MPVSHIGLTVSHLPSSTSFFLAALQPLGYRYIGEFGSQVGLGIRDADFFLCQEAPGVKAGAAHIAFTASSTTAVRNFYAAALIAGGRSNGAPATRSAEDGHFNAAILDLDGNTIEVMFRNGPDLCQDGTVIEHSRVITWQRSISERYSDDRSVASSRTAVSRSAPTEVMSKAASVVSKAPSATPRAGGLARSVSEPIVPQVTASPASSDGTAKQIIGTLIGAAAGAAVAYAMVKSEQDSARKETDFASFIDTKSTVKAAVGFLAQVASQPAPPAQPAPIPEEVPVPAAEPARSTVQPVNRDLDAQSYHTPIPTPPRSILVQRQIEPASASYYAPSQVSKAPTQTGEELRIEYTPASSVASSRARSKYASQRSVTNPELLTIEKARSIASTVKPTGVAKSVAAGSLISSFVPDNTRRSSEGSVLSHQSSRSKAESSHSRSSRRSSESKQGSSSPKEEGSSSASAIAAPPPKVPSKAKSLINSVLGRNAKSVASKLQEDDNEIDDWELDDESDDDGDTVVPGDSVSQVGSSASSRRPRRSHRTKKLHSDSVVSKNSTSSSSTSSSKHSKHSHRSHRSHKSRSHEHSHSHSDASGEESDKRRRPSRPSVISEPSDVSTVRPIKSSSSSTSRSKSLRKDSLTYGQYDGLFDEVQSAMGTSVPVRGITESMVSAARKNTSRKMVNYSHAQKVRVFED